MQQSPFCMEKAGRRSDFVILDLRQQGLQPPLEDPSDAGNRLINRVVHGWATAGEACAAGRADAGGQGLMMLQGLAS